MGGVIGSTGVDSNSKDVVLAKYGQLTSIYHPVSPSLTDYANRAKNIGCYSTHPSEFSYEVKFAYKQYQQDKELRYEVSVVIGDINITVKMDRFGKLLKKVYPSEYAKVWYSRQQATFPVFTLYIHIDKEQTVFKVYVRMERASVEAIIRSILQLKPGSNSPIPSTQVPQSLSAAAECPRLFGLAATEVLYGANLMLVVLRVNNRGLKEYIRRPLLTRVVRGIGCTLNDKTFYLNKQNGAENTDVTEGIIGYGMLRYFLWFLITKRWNVYILRRSRTKEFLTTLADSEYAYWLPVVANSAYEQYFIR